MRKARRESPFMPYATALLISYMVTLLLAVLTSLLLWAIDGIAASGAAAVIILAMCAFVGGRVGGSLKKANGLKVGALCGILYYVPILILSLAFGVCGSAMIFIKLVLCLAFAAAGGVAGVNSRQ